MAQKSVAEVKSSIAESTSQLHRGLIETKIKCTTKQCKNQMAVINIFMRFKATSQKTRLWIYYKAYVNTFT